MNDLTYFLKYVILIISEEAHLCANRGLTRYQFGGDFLISDLVAKDTGRRQGYEKLCSEVKRMR